MGNRANGEGTLYREAGRDRWVGQLYVNGRRRKVTGRTRVEAAAALVKLRSAATSGLNIPEGRGSSQRSAVTVTKVLDDWITRDMAGRDLAPSTATRHRWAAEKIKSEMGSALAATLSVRAIDEMLDRLADAGLSRASISKVQGTLSQALRFAVRRGDLDRNVATDATIPPSAARSVARRSLSPDDARSLLLALRDERNGLMFALSLRLGLRPGEAAAIYWSDVSGDVLNVTRGLRLDKGRPVIVDDLKTASSKRTIEMPADLVDWFAAHRADQVAERLAARSWVDDRLVFASPTGNVLSPPNARRHLTDICDRAGVPAMKFNELRHSCASLLSDIGVPNESIADLLGHTTTRMVDATYRHRLRPVVDVAARADWTTTAT